MDVQQIFIHDTTWVFVAELIIRAALMFGMIIIFLRLTGKRGVRQLSIFELAIILSLGSIAGDPMFTEDLPLVHALVVMAVVIAMYRLITWLMMKYQAFEDLVEGKSLYIVEDGELVLEKIKLGKMTHDEFFAEMRQQGVEHLGQVRVGLLESDGKFSMLFFLGEATRYGLPLFPKACQAIHRTEPHTYYACMYCGHVSLLEHANVVCPRCSKQQWTQAINTPYRA